MACAVLHQALRDLPDRRYGLQAARFLAEDWRHSWAPVLPARLSQHRLRTLVREALDPSEAEERRRTCHRLTRRQRAEQRAILACAGLVPGPQITVLAGSWRVNSPPGHTQAGPRGPEPLTSPLPGCSAPRCTLDPGAFCRPVCGRESNSHCIEEDGLRVRA